MRDDPRNHTRRSTILRPFHAVRHVESHQLRHGDCSTFVLIVNRPSVPRTTSGQGLVQYYVYFGDYSNVFRDRPPTGL